ncbi:hypothetical protein BN1723_019566, partial [Verticillium longisporum]
PRLWLLALLRRYQHAAVV